MRLFAFIVAGLLALPLTSNAQCRHAAAFGFGGGYGYATGLTAGVDSCGNPVTLAAPVPVPVPVPTYGYGLNGFGYHNGFAFNRGFGYGNGFAFRRGVNRFGGGFGGFGAGGGAVNQQRGLFNLGVGGGRGGVNQQRGLFNFKLF